MSIVGLDLGTIQEISVKQNTDTKQRQKQIQRVTQKQKYKPPLFSFEYIRPPTEPKQKKRLPIPLFKLRKKKPIKKGLPSYMDAYRERLFKVLKLV